MFRTRRSVSTRKLWRQRCTTPNRGQGEGASPNPDDLQNALRQVAHQLFKKLKDEQLWQLAEAVECKGRWDCGCVWVPWDSRAGKQGLAPHVLLCRLYRWPDLRQAGELKRLLECEAYWKKNTDGGLLCCNPYHFSRLSAPDEPPPLSCKVREPTRPALTESYSYHPNVRGWQDTTLSRSTNRDSYWCKLAYWEHRTRVGRLYNVSEPSIHIFHDLPKGSGFCLGHLGSESRNEAVKRTRVKIGQGVILSREVDGVWVYNRSDHPIFINSPTLAPINTRGQLVYKVLSGYSIKVFDAERALSLSGCSALGDGPCDPHSVRISFAKGWGSCYSRQFITSCPCWLEILLNRPR
ncbi:mothers against decapentaplegic homolog 6 [Bombina bombina]|uniref:mothers against decapentaplegic homolog 6 n=1 Tax=Bombina bombina TaxID=8345 RepID=UPI00235A82A8|nr:mothers against decapentaplegic homolog 6 [Bombina bombina]XP_053559524.1 mothers against decapentaplegic homolog 6 [Bombina bombina]